MRKLCVLWICVICFAFIGCKTEYIEIAPRPTFKQVFTFSGGVSEDAKNMIEAIYNKMSDEELVDLKYNYFSAIPVFGYPNNIFNPRDIIEYRGNAIHIRGEPDDFEKKFLAALDRYKDDDLNKLY